MPVHGTLPMSTNTQRRVADLCRNLSFVLAACLPFLAPFNPLRNIDLQGLVLLISGGFAWCALLLGYRGVLQSLGWLEGGLLTVFSVCCVASLLINPHFSYGVLGAPFVRLGTGGYLACIGIGILGKTIKLEQLLLGLYVLIVGLAVVSVPYSWLHFHSLLRMGGVFAQADIMACFIGCGLLIGLGMWGLCPKQRRLLLGIQGFLVGLLLLTQTRAVLFLVIGLYLIFMIKHRRRGSPLVIVAVIAALLLFGTLHYFLPSRITDRAYVVQSISYRLSLQKYAVQTSAHRPFLGYGPGNLADALACSRLPAGSLQTTCKQGYFFNSSHNIFIDRVLAIGWLGGLSYLGLVVLALYRGWRGNKTLQIVGYTLTLIGCYYLTNVTSLTLELLFWILLMQSLFALKKTKHPA